VIELGLQRGHTLARLVELFSRALELQLTSGGGRYASA
jgi:hypothetical protein